MSIIRQIPELNFLVSGETKQQALEQIFNPKENQPVSPAVQLIKNFNGRIIVLCDQKASPISGID